MLTDKKESYNKYNTLNCIPQILMNRNVLIDLRNECSVAGKIVDADGFMNISMENCIYTNQKGLHYEMDNFSILARYIRYIHIPKDIKIVPEIKKFIEGMSGYKKRNKNEKKTFKKSRAERKQKETLEELQAESTNTNSNSSC